jgi:phospholipase C
MIRKLSSASAAAALVTTVAALLIASTGSKTYPSQSLPMTLEQQRHIELIRVGAKPSHLWVYDGKVRHLITLPTQIQHVVVIDMENRTVDNLLSAYYAQSFQGSASTQWHNVMNLHDPTSLMPTPLTTNLLSARFDPHHQHDDFLNEVGEGFNWPNEGFSCSPGYCSPPPSGPLTGYSYVPMWETSVYAGFIQNYASADEVFQANQGPSMPSHQYLIAGQSGGIAGSTYAPVALADNPKVSPTPGTAEVDFVQDPEQGDDTVYCNVPNNKRSLTLDMTQPWPETVDEFSSPLPPCEVYGHGTILDEIASISPVTYDDWQYIAASNGGYWAAPTSVKNLYDDWSANTADPNQPFIKDPNAYKFVQNIQRLGNSPRPFAALTYVTPCSISSDHADTSGNDVFGPAWVGTVVNAIGNSTYWDHTAIIITWDDWGGWYDHVHWPESILNPYPNGMSPPPNLKDPNEWGLRVPLIIISPYAKTVGYVSHGPGGTLTNPIPRSQSAILNLVETIFDLGSLNADDYANRDSSNNVDDMMDMFNFSPAPRAFSPAPIYSGYQFLDNCSPPPVTPTPPP